MPTLLRVPAVLLALGAALIPLASAAPAEATSRLRIQPAQPAANQPVEIILAHSDRFEITGHQAEGFTVRIDTVELAGAPTGEGLHFAQTLELPPFPFDRPTELEWWHQPLGGSPQRIERREIFASMGVTLVLPPRIEENTPFTLSVDGYPGFYSVDPCNEFENSPAIDGQTITLTLGGNCALIPAPPDFVRLPLAMPGLAAGSYRLQVRTRFISPADLTYATAAFEVLPKAATLQQDRFAVKVAWSADGQRGEGKLVKLPGPDSALYYLFSPENWELMIKVLDGCAINGHYWVFGAASTAVGYEIEVRDLDHPEAAPKVYTNPEDTPSEAITDIAAFACD